MIKNLTDNQKVYLQTGLMVGIVVLLGCTWLWWVKVYTNPRNIFSDMLSNSLNTYGVTKTTTQDDTSGKLTQITQAQFGSQNLVQEKSTITQPTESGDATVTTEAIGNGTDNFVRYVDISVPTQKDKAPLDFSALKGIWGKQPTEPGVGNSSFSEVLYGAVLFGYLPSKERSELLHMINDTDIYNVDYGKLTYKNENGKDVIVYPVQIATQPYVQLLKRYDEMLGLKLMSQVSPDEYANSPAISLSLSIDKTSRTLTKVSYSGGQREEVLSGYGIHKNVTIPTNTISSTELEGKLQSVLGE